MMKRILLITLLYTAVLGSLTFNFAQVNQQWIHRMNGAANASDHGHDVAVDPSGNIYVTGWIEVAAGNQDCFTVKYSPDGDSLWGKFYHGS
ncbi:MAG TPA: SBBP repeat-containing protein, partial [Ignavibacteriaceae bacterium]